MTDIIAQFKKSEHDTGSVEVQVIMLTTRINQLNEHFKAHPKDFGSKRGLLLLVGQRRKFLDYIKHKDDAQYKMMIEKLGLRK